MNSNVKKIKLGLGAFDLCKGLAMIMIVTGHMISYYDVEQLTLLYPFLILLKVFGSACMPMFFIISGFAFKPKPSRKLLKKSAKALVVPYLYVMTAVVMIFPIIHRMQYKWLPGTINETMRWFLAFLFGVPKPGKVLFGYSLRCCSATWFLLALFLAQNLLNGILKLKNEKIQYLIVGLCIALGYVLAKSDVTYFCIPQALIAVSFCYLGYMIKKYNLLDYLLSSRVALVLLTASSTIFIIGGQFDLAYSEFKFFPIDFAGTLCAGVLFLLLNVHINKYNWNALNWVRKIGMYSYWIVCIHSVEMSCIPWLKFNKLMPPEYQIWFFIIEIVLKTAIISTFCFLLSQISKTKYRKKLRKSE